MPNRTSNIFLLRQRVIESSESKSPHLIGSRLREAGVLDRAVLNREIEAILDGVSEKPALAPRMQRSLEAFVRALHEVDIPKTAKHVCALLSLGLDDLRKAALLSLMMRMAGKRKFDPIASYILQNQKVLVPGRG